MSVAIYLEQIVDTSQDGGRFRAHFTNVIMNSGLLKLN